MLTSNDGVLEGASIHDLQSQSPERRVGALEMLFRNASMLYGDTVPVTVAERHHLEAARLVLLQSISGSDRKNI
jgi:hypothetical protein